MPEPRRSSSRPKRQFQRQLEQHGPGSLRRSLRSLEKRLAEHSEKLKQFKEMGGYTGSVQREIRNFKSQIAALKDLLGDKP